MSEPVDRHVCEWIRDQRGDNRNRQVATQQPRGPCGQWNLRNGDQKSEKDPRSRTHRNAAAIKPPQAGTRKHRAEPAQQAMRLQRLRCRKPAPKPSSVHDARGVPAQSKTVHPATDSVTGSGGATARLPTRNTENAIDICQFGAGCRAATPSLNHTPGAGISTKKHGTRGRVPRSGTWLSGITPHPANQPAPCHRAGAAALAIRYAAPRSPAAGYPCRRRP